MALLTADDLTAAVAAPTGDAAMVARLAAAADRAVRQFLGRDFTAGPFTESHPGGGRVLVLAHFPVAAVTSLRVDAARDFPTSQRAADDELPRPPGPRRDRKPGRPVRAGGAGGGAGGLHGRRDGAPDTVKQATLLLGEHWYREAKTHAATGQQNVGTAADGTVYPWGQSGGYRLPPAVLQLLRLERVPAI